MKNTWSCLAGLASLAALSCHGADKPNVILVLADDLGYGDISALNPQSKIETPNIDALSRGGITFTDAHATSSLSTPSRYSILTGRYSWRTTLKKGVGVGYSGPMITEGRATLASMFSESGYHTACIGKWHLGWNWAPKAGAKNEKDVDFSQPITAGVTERGGFDYFYGIAASLDMPPYVYVENDRATAVPDSISERMDGLRLFRSGPIAPDFDPRECLENFFRRAMNYVDAQKESGQPFFLYLPLTAPHTPILPSKKYEGKTSIGPYGDFVVMIDDLLGELVARLKANGQWDNTILIFTSDNGCAPYINIPVLERQGHYPSYIYRGAKTDIYEGGHRMPLIVTWGNRYNQVIDTSLVSLSDLYATFAEMVDHKLRDNEAEDSYSFWRNLTRTGTTDRRDLISLSGFGYLALRVPDLKLIFWCGSGGQSYPTKPEDLVGLPDMQLYDMECDVRERINLIDDPKYRKTVEELTARMRSYVDNGRSTPGKPQKNDTDNHWEQTKLF